MPNDLFQFSSGLRDDYTFVVYMAEFAINAESDSENYNLILTGIDEADGEDVTEMFGVGKDWFSEDGGLTLVHPKGGNRRINRSTNYAKFCEFAMTSMTEAKSTFLESDTASPFVAATWINTKWHMHEEMVGEGFTGRDGKEVKDRYRTMPVEFLGFVDNDGNVIGMDPDSTPAKSAAKPKAASPKAAAKPAPAPDKAAALLAAAKASKAAPEAPASIEEILAGKSRELEWDDFLAFALSQDELLANDELAADVIDSTDEGFYTRNRNA